MRARFQDRLIKRILELEALSQDIRKQGATHSQLNEIVIINHKLAGIGPSLGYKELGSLARDIERNILLGLKSGTPQAVWEQVANSLERLLEHLESLLDED